MDHSSMVDMSKDSMETSSELMMNLWKQIIEALNLHIWLCNLGRIRIVNLALIAGDVHVLSHWLN
jgi:hypothetical protein